MELLDEPPSLLRPVADCSHAVDLFWRGLDLGSNRWTLSFGIGGNSPLPERVDDRFGIGWYYVGISDEFDALANLIDDGQGVELFYDIAISETFRLAVNLQVVDPTFTGADTAVVPGVRGRIEF